MALKIDLKPNERLVVSGAVIRNGRKRAELIIENNTPILREKDIMRPEEATTYCGQIYLAVQMMYLDGDNLAQYHKTYWSLVRDLVREVPSTLPLVGEISGHLLKNEYYQAIRQAGKLMDYEQEVLNRVRSAT
ncbi:MAG: flagellar biosynthesis repressor FlbT [Syntrophales bacterium]|jgi:flagellar protein FlbT|nr:flagellar biosynthesis repressor FlbT [Syntrophales bacterium]NLN61000.1 flagellar protein FlbT [Deltaproteobacteria bacterium]